MNTTRLIRLVSALAVLVMVFGVTAALADGVTSSRRAGDLVTSNTFHAFNPIAASHVDFATESAVRSNGIREGYLLRERLLNGPKANIISNPQPPQETPEPGTLLMLAVGLGTLFVGWRQRACQS
ncbi:MAG: PEP-CTERM sorting domain-containing protein [Candidatus Acidiferrales bacterium]